LKNKRIVCQILKVRTPKSLQKIFYAKVLTKKAVKNLSPLEKDILIIIA
jgi:hypothetical protein